jgi:hypothetical protein
MRRFWTARFYLTLAAILIATAGCSGRPKADQAKVDAIAQEKVDLMRRLADEVAKNPGGVGAAGLVEEFINTPFDPEAYPTQAAEIVKVYNERVKGKLRGEAAGQIQAAMAQIQKPQSIGK